MNLQQKILKLFAGLCFGFLILFSVQAEKKEELLVLTEEFPPINYSEEGKATGFAVEVVQEIFRRLNSCHPIKIVKWSEGYQKALKRPNTVLFATSRTAEREDLFKWVGPLVKCNIGFYTHTNSNLKINSLDEGKKVRRIGTVTDHASEQLLKKNGFENLLSSPEPETCIRNLVNGWVDTWVMTDLVVPHVASKAAICPGLIKQIYCIEEPTNYIAFSKKTSDRLVRRWQKALDSMKKDGTYEKLRKKWLSLDKVSRTDKLLSKEQLDIAKKVKLKLYTEEWAPINFSKGGKPTGFSVELVREILKHHGQRDNIKIIPWHKGYQEALNGPDVALFSTARTITRDKLFKWVGPLFTQTYSLVAKKGGTIVKNLKEAKHVRCIGTYKDDVGEQVLKELGFTNLKSVEKNADNIKLLKEGKIDLWVSSNLTFVPETLEAGYAPSDFVPVCDIQQLDLYIAFSKDTPDEVIYWWQNTLDHLKRDGTYKKIAELWIPSLEKPQNIDTAISGKEAEIDRSIIESNSNKKFKTISLSEEQKKWLEEHPVIKLAPDPDCPPLEYFNQNGVYCGIAADYVNLVEQKLGIKFKIIRFKDWDEVLLNIKEKRIDMLGGTSHTPERARYLNFSRPYQVLDVQIIVRKDLQMKLDLEKIRGWRVAVVKGYAIQEYLETNYPDINIDIVENASDAVRKVSTGQVDATLLDMFDASYCIKQEGILNLRVAGNTGYVYHLGFAVRKDWPELISILNKGLASITPEEERMISNKWVSLQQDRLSKKVIITLLSILGVIIAGFLLIVFWNRSLRRQVDNRTKELQVELNERIKAEMEIIKYRDHLEELVKDRTEELKDSEEKFKTLFEAATASIFLMKRGIFIDCNAQTLKMYGCRRDQIIGESPEKFSPPIQPDGVPSKVKVHKRIKKVLEGDPQFFEWRHIRLDGTEFDAEVSLNEIEIKGTLYIQAIVNDITEKKRVKEQLEIAKAKAEQGAKAKTEFLSSMSHEIRTPLNAILGFSQLMRNDSGLTREQRENLDVINRSGEHLLNLINQILEMSKIDAGHEELNEKSFDLARFISDLELMFLIRADAKQLSFDVVFPDDVPRYIKTDEGKLRQVLVNLLGNAIKFTEKGGIILRAGRQRGQGRGDDMLTFEVEDSGPGIEDIEKKKLFTTFVQTAAGKKSGKGTGLGLAISQKFVKMMGGDIRVKSEVGKGTCFHLEIALKETDASQLEDTKVDRKVLTIKPGQQEYRFLIVEDEQENRQLMTKILTSVGFKVQTAVNGKDGIEKWELWQPHLIWMDMRMPEMDGYEATQFIKNTPEGKDTVIIALTANAFKEEQIEIYDSGCDDLLCKPFKEIEIFEKIEKHLKIEFIYEEPDKMKQFQETTRITCMSLVAEVLQQIPEELIQNMQEATLQADFELLMEEINEVAKFDESLSLYLKELANNFDYDTLLKLFKQKGCSDAE